MPEWEVGGPQKKQSTHEPSEDQQKKENASTDIRMGNRTFIITFERGLIMRTGSGRTVSGSLSPRNRREGGANPVPERLSFTRRASYSSLTRGREKHACMTYQK